MSGMLESLIRKIKEHAQEWADLPKVIVPSAAVTDSDVDAWSDLRYMRELVDDLLHVASVTHGCCPQLEEMLDRSVITEWDGYHEGLELWPDPAGELLRQWRIELDDEEDVAA